MEMGEESNKYIEEVAWKTKQCFDPSNPPLKSCHMSLQHLWLSTTLSIKAQLPRTGWSHYPTCPSRIPGDEPAKWKGNW